MKIGEFLVAYKYISSDALNEALKLQKINKDARLGEILVGNGAITKEVLSDCIAHFMEVNKDADLGEAKEWLNQSDVDRLISKYVR
jgi:hypothetical protein